MSVYGELEFCTNTTRGVNAGMSADTLQLIQPRPDLPRDCTYRDSSGRGLYCSDATTWQAGGKLIHRAWTGDTCSDRTYVHKPNDSTPCHFVSAPKWTLPNQDTFKVSFIMRVDDLPGRKVAFLRWCGPRVGEPGYCEDNMPEAKLEAGPRGFAFHHHQSSKSQTAFQLGTNGIELDQWHLYEFEVRACNSVTFKVDGVVEGHVTGSTVTCSPSYYVFQFETYLSGQALPTPWPTGDLEMDWVRIETN